VPHRLKRRRWDETRGDEFASRSRSVRYFEVGAEADFERRWGSRSE